MCTVYCVCMWGCTSVLILEKGEGCQPMSSTWCSPLSVETGSLVKPKFTSWLDGLVIELRGSTCFHPYCMPSNRVTGVH